MKQLLFTIFVAGFIALIVYIVATDVDIEKLEQEQLQFAKDCYNMNYELEVCRSGIQDKD